MFQQQIAGAANDRCIVNKNAIALLTSHQKYYGVNLLYQRCRFTGKHSRIL